MKEVINIFSAITMLVAATVIGPKLLKEFQKETIRKLDRGISPLSTFTKSLTRRSFKGSR